MPFIYSNIAFAAASTCFPETISTYYTSTENPGSAYDWRASYTSGMYLRGVGICSNSSGSHGDTITTIYRHSTSSHNSHCWCKLTYPIESKFIYYKNYSSESECAQTCQINCTNLNPTGNTNNIAKVYFENPEGE